MCISTSEWVVHLPKSSFLVLTSFSIKKKKKGKSKLVIIYLDRLRHVGKLHGCQKWHSLNLEKSSLVWLDPIINMLLLVHTSMLAKNPKNLDVYKCMDLFIYQVLKKIILWCMHQQAIHRPHLYEACSLSACTPI